MLSKSQTSSSFRSCKSTLIVALPTNDHSAPRWRPVGTFRWLIQTTALAGIFVGCVAITFVDRLFAANPPPVPVDLTNREVGVGFGNPTENDNAFDLIVDLNPPAGQSIKWPSHKHDEGEIAWGLIYNGDGHRWTGAGVIANKDHHVRFSGQLEGGQGGTGSPDFYASVVDLDIDADTTDARTASHCPPTFSVAEDKKEDEELGGLWLEKGMIERLDPNNHTFPDNIPTSQLDTLPYKILHLKCIPKWHTPNSPLGFVQFLDYDNYRLYDIDTGNRVRGSVDVPATTGVEKDFALVTNNDFLYSTIRARFIWYSYSVASAGTPAEDLIKLRSSVVIEADIVDNPPAGATYYSGIDDTTVVLKLNESVVGADTQLIANGMHVHYQPRRTDLVAGPNKIELFGKDRAGNDADIATRIWYFTQ